MDADRRDTIADEALRADVAALTVRLMARIDTLEARISALEQGTEQREAA